MKGREVRGGPVGLCGRWGGGVGEADAAGGVGAGRVSGIGRWCGWRRQAERAGILWRGFESDVSRRLLRPERAVRAEVDAAARRNDAADFEAYGLSKKSGCVSNPRARPEGAEGGRELLRQRE